MQETENITHSHQRQASLPLTTTVNTIDGPEDYAQKMATKHRTSL